MPDPALAYHEASRLSPGEAAAVPERLDPATEPAPFRRYPGAPLSLLDEGSEGPGPAPAALDRGWLSRLFHNSLALSGWKGQGKRRYSLRVPPSAGNLHPLEAYLLCGAVPGLSACPGLYHYSPFDHGLERRAELPEAVWQAAGAPGEVIVGFTALPWRTAWKYGERAFRLIQLDAGHAAAAVALAAAAEGWTCRALPAGGAELAALLGVDGAPGFEAEHPVLALALAPGREPRIGPPPAAAAASLHSLPLAGEPSRLSRGGRCWPALAAMLGAAAGSAAVGPGDLALPTAVPDRAAWPAPARRRRSCNRFDAGGPPLPAERFRHLLAGLAEATPGLEVAFFLHAVQGTVPGLYLWDRTAGDDRPLRLLHGGASRQGAAAVACGQPAAGEALLTAVFAAELPALTASAAAYGHLHRQAGAAGHLLYLHAGELGLAATGLSGFFDALLARLLEACGRPLHPLYLLAVGHPAGPDGLLPVPPYAHRSAAPAGDRP